MKENILEIDNLKVVFGENRVLDIDRRIEIKQGDVVGIIGENGAGKSTLINAVLAEIKYSGTINRNFNFDDVGVQFQSNNYNHYMRVDELIKVVTGRSVKSMELESYLNEFELKPLLKKKTGVLSGGEKQRLTLFLVVYLKPEVLFLDELTTGLDYKKREKILSIIKRYSKKRTVFSVTHYFDELNNFANKVIILHKGKCLYFGEIKELEQKIYYHRIIKIKEDGIKLPEQVKQQNEIIRNEEDEVFIITKDKDELNMVLEQLADHNIEYEILGKNLYSLYILTLYKGIGGGSDV